MIQRLLIKNFALIDELEIHFSEKLTIITGETGAGKSILLGALGLIMGNRADHVSLYNPAEKCVIEGYFKIGHYEDLKEFFAAQELDYEDEIVVRREITPTGKSRSFVNDTPVTLKILQQLSAALIDLHLQFDTLDIHEVSFQLRMIDALADNKIPLSKYQTQYKTYQADQRKLAALIERSQNAAREVDFLTFQLNEFSKADLVAGEQEKLEAEQVKLANAEVIKRTLAGAYGYLADNENSIISQLKDVARSVATVQKFSTAITKIQGRYEGFIAEIQEIASDYEQIADSTELDGERIQELETRLNIIYKLLKKHGVASVAELIQIQTDIQSRLAAFGDLSTDIAALEQSIAKNEVELKEKSIELSARRKNVIPSFEEKVQQQLIQLSMEHARLKVSINPLSTLTTTGADEVEFMFAPNKGSKFQSIKDVASGGELSRLTLITKSLVASAIPLPTLIFDEIDTGISGDVALKMGVILQQLSAQHQVVSITHSPQIAAKAHTHYFVYKKVLEDRTVTNIRSLNHEERILAIATMLSTNPPSAGAIKNAEELLATHGSN